MIDTGVDRMVFSVPCADAACSDILFIIEIPSAKARAVQPEDGFLELPFTNDRKL